MARKLIIDRFEGKFAVCEEFQPEQKGAKEKKPAKNAKEIRFFGIERAELPLRAPSSPSTMTASSRSMRRQPLPAAPKSGPRRRASPGRTDGAAVRKGIEMDGSVE